MKLKKELLLIDVFCIATGAMISSGIFILPGLAFTRVGPSLFVSYIIAGFFALTGLLSSAELATALPKAGGNYFFITRGLGPAIGTIDGLLSWFSLSLKSSFALVGMAAFTRLIIPGYNIQTISVALCIFFVLLNILGIKEAGRFQVFLVISLIALIILFVIRGITEVQIENLTPFYPYGLESVIATAGFVFVSYGGLLHVVSVAEEIKNPNKVIPLGMLLSLFAVILFYGFMVFVTVGVTPAEILKDNPTPISAAASFFMGSFGRVALSIAAILAFVSTANAGIMSASRYPMALSRDYLLPGIFSRINKRFKTPHTAIIATGSFMIMSLFLKLDMLVKSASIVLILSYIFANLCVIILRESRLRNYQPAFRSPLYPWVQICGIIGFSILLFEMGRNSIYIAILLVMGGLLVYFLYGRFRSIKESAFLHLIARITAREFVTRHLEREFKEIIRERDSIIQDRFDSIIENSLIYDLKGPIEIDEFFTFASEKMSERINLTEQEIHSLLVERENESTTALTRSLAIPHIVIDGENIFDIFLFRCSDGIIFSENKRISTVFVIIGSKDERNFHLRALSAIAQIVQDPYFEEKWLSAKNIEDIRDLILLSNRQRFH